jgi:histidine triad (HIT) family protein
LANRRLVVGLLLRLARSPAGGRLANLVFSRMSFLLPVERLHETETLLAFHHPRPAYPVHILIVPKKAIAGLTALTPGDTPFLLDLVDTVGRLVADLQLELSGYRLIANGGRYQDIPQLHFHLVSGHGDE